MSLISVPSQMNPLWILSSHSIISFHLRPSRPRYFIHQVSASNSSKHFSSPPHMPCAICTAHLFPFDMVFRPTLAGNSNSSPTKRFQRTTHMYIYAHVHNTYIHKCIQTYIHRSGVILVYSKGIFVYTPTYATVIKVQRSVMLILWLYHLNEHMSWKLLKYP